LITSNIFVNNKGGIEIGYDGGGFQGNWWKLPPQEMIISNNIIVGSSDTLIKLYVEPVNTRWDGNLVCAKGSATVSTHPIAGIKNVTEKELPPLRFKRSLTAKDVGPDASE
jgi:hypothetical protein